MDLQNLLVRRAFIINSFEIYGGVSGLIDFGPAGTILKDNIIDVWKKHFIINDGMFQIETTNLTLGTVLSASGHVQRFNDFIVKDINGVFHRADKLLEENINKKLLTEKNQVEIDRLEKLKISADSLSKEELDTALEDSNVSKCSPFNLMFSTNIGPSSQIKAYLRPETAQGIFVNFKRLLENKSGKIPFACAQIGTGFRNEISPKGGLLRVREFTMAEIEYFIYPGDKTHENFNDIKDIEVALLSSKEPFVTEIISMDKAVKTELLNESLAYFIARAYLFFKKIGIDTDKLRFRQHLPNEMAHYASDCWDAEILLSVGWVECAGFADRSCYDLSSHMKATNTDLRAYRKLEVPIQKHIKKFKINKNLIGPSFRNEAKMLCDMLENMNESEVKNLDTALNVDSIILPGFQNPLLREHVEVIDEIVNEYVEHFIPGVIEPSFGIGRIVHAVLEHSFSIKSKESNVLSFPIIIAPYKCGILPHGNSFDIDLCKKIEKELRIIGINTISDFSGASIGRRYARMDEIGVSFIITSDDTTKVDNSVTIRNRDTEEQIRISKENLMKIIKSLLSEEILWIDIFAKYSVL